MTDTKQPPPTALDAVVDALAPIWDDAMPALTRDQILAVATAIATDAPTRTALAVLVTEAWEVAAMTHEQTATADGVTYLGAPPVNVIDCEASS